MSKKEVDPFLNEPETIIEARKLAREKGEAQYSRCGTLVYDDTKLLVNLPDHRLAAQDRLLAYQKAVWDFSQNQGFESYDEFNDFGDDNEDDLVSQHTVVHFEGRDMTVGEMLRLQNAQEGRSKESVEAAEAVEEENKETEAPSDAVPT